MNIPHKNVLLAIGAIVLLVLAYFGFQYYSDYQKNVTVPTTVEKVMNTDLNLSFAYPIGEGGLTLIEPPVSENGLLKSYILMPGSEYNEFSQATEPREAPASISVLVFTLDSGKSTSTSADSGSTTERESRITRLQNWAMDNNTLTSFNQAKSVPDIVEIDSVKALHYQADGLYQQDIYLASYKNRVYMFTSQYNEQTDLTYTAFQELINSVSF